MSGTSKSYLDEGKMQQIFYIDESLLRKLKAYAMETGQSFHELINIEFSNFEQSLILKSTEIDKIRYKALEEAKIASENPMLVSGHKEPILIEPSITQ